MSLLRQIANGPAVIHGSQLGLKYVAWFELADCAALLQFQENEEIFDTPRRVNGVLYLRAERAAIDKSQFGDEYERSIFNPMALDIRTHNDLIRIGWHWSEANIEDFSDARMLRDHLAEQARQHWVDEAAQLIHRGPDVGIIIDGLLKRAHAYRLGLRESDGSTMRSSRELLKHADWRQPAPLIADEPGFTAVHPNGTLFDIFDDVYFALLDASDWKS